MTDKQRWADDGNYDHNWTTRTTWLYRMIPEHYKTILEFGAGMCYTVCLLKEHQIYTPSDLINRDEYARGRGEPTIVMDLNSDPWDIEGPYDVVLMSGVFEYVEDVETLIGHLADITKMVVCSYSDTTNANRNKRNGWVNSMTQAEFRDLFGFAGFDIIERSNWNGQALYKFQADYIH